MILPFRHHLRNTAITAGKLAVLRIAFRQVFSGPNRRKSHLTFKNLLPIQICEHPGNVSVDANRLFFDLFWAKRFAQIDTAIHRFRISRRHLPERILDDARRICPYSQFQKQNASSLMEKKEILIALCGRLPALILHKSIINPQIHRHRSPANRAPGDQLCGDLHVFLLGNHFPDKFLIVIRLLTAGFGALPQTIIALGVKQAALIKPGNLELMVHIGGQDKIVFAVYQSQQIAVRFSSSGLITVD